MRFQLALFALMCLAVVFAAVRRLPDWGYVGLVLLYLVAQQTKPEEEEDDDLRGQD